jgi:hypothetical protein
MVELAQMMVTELVGVVVVEKKALVAMAEGLVEEMAVTDYKTL